jgi:hypothetical protein
LAVILDLTSAVPNKPSEIKKGTATPKTRKTVTFKIARHPKVGDITGQSGTSREPEIEPVFILRRSLLQINDV